MLAQIFMTMDFYVKALITFVQYLEKLLAPKGPIHRNTKVSKTKTLAKFLAFVNLFVHTKDEL